MKRDSIQFIFFYLFLFISATVNAQLTAPGASFTEKTQYPVFQEADDIFIFCTEDSMANVGVLQVATELSGTKTFLWEKYNEQADAFEFFFSENTDGMNSEISSLESGGYRITITQGASTEVSRAWLFNNWTVAEGYISDSNCESFKLNGEFRTAQLNYFDLADHNEIQVFKDIKVQWKVGSEVIASVLNPQIFDPPTKNTDYTIRVYDKFNCEGTAQIRYESIVTRASFEADPLNGEAPLEVVFTNTSENGDLDQYEWFFYRNLDDIKRESEGSTVPVDSIEVIAFDENPVYTYEFTGTYKVKLVSKKVSEFHTCVDTFHIPDFIIVDSSFVAVPNVFTPNGDGTNDNFVVKFWSMQSIEISIFNRWGKRIHHWESGDVRGFEGTWMETVWDGRLMGGRYASPGVYYYTVVGEGRDGKRRRARGFFHLFRDKE